MFVPNFSHIYIEKSAEDLTETLKLIKRFPRAEIIKISSYKEIFNRPKQDRQLQKKSIKLIIAKKKENFLYPATSIAQNFGHTYFYYNTLLLNCIYNCDYCYLQGMYPSANIVYFANQDDFQTETARHLETLGSMYLCISYDTDLLGFENIFGLNSIWIEFARNHKNILIESRTKSANFKALESTDPVLNFILAWTISPEFVQSENESGTPLLSKRLSALKMAIERGWRVRICIDPLLWFPNWEESYRNLIFQINESIDLKLVQDISIGSFRMNTEFLKNIKAQGVDSKVLYHPFVNSDGLTRYSPEQENRLRDFVFNQLVLSGFPSQSIAIA